MGLPLAAGDYRLDQHHSQIGFTVVHLGLTPIRGLFPDFDGLLRIGSEPSDTTLQVSVGLPSVQSGHPGRDERLQTADYFDTALHPTMVFESTAVDGEDERWVVDGQLTIKGTTAPLRLDVTMTGRSVFPLDEKEHIGFVASGWLSRRAFGVAPDVPDDILSDGIDLAIAAQLITDFRTS
jgi:polyisoprenoid-binding protein YceI